MCAGIPHPEHWQHTAVLAGVRGLLRDLGAITAQSARQFGSSTGAPTLLSKWWAEVSDCIPPTQTLKMSSQVQADLLEAQAGLGRFLQQAAQQGWAVTDPESSEGLDYTPLAVEMAAVPPQPYVNSRPAMAAPPVAAPPVDWSAATAPALTAYDVDGSISPLARQLRVDTSCSASPERSESPGVLPVSEGRLFNSQKQEPTSADKRRGHVARPMCSDLLVGVVAWCAYC